VLDRLIESVRAGDSRALVLCGEAGAGKTALLDYLAGHALGCRVARAAGVQSDMELAFAAVHQLCAPMLGHLARLPGPQREALSTAFGISAGPPPDRFLIGLAVLGLLSDVAGKRPLVCLVDDQQWLDRASAQVLAFVARRLEAESVGLVFAVREAGEELGGLPELIVEGLRDDDARALLNSAFTGPLDARVRDQIVSEARGNPLALLELPRGLTPAELAGGFGLPGAIPLPGRLEDRSWSRNWPRRRPGPGTWRPPGRRWNGYPNVPASAPPTGRWASRPASAPCLVRWGLARRGWAWGAQRRRERRPLPPGVDPPARPHPAPRRTRPRPPALRRVAAPRAPAR